MHEIKASVLLAKGIDDDTRTIRDIIKTLPSKEGNIIWMYLTIKTNLDVEDEIKIGFDIIQVDEESDFGIELGEFVVGRTKDKRKKEEIFRKHGEPKGFMPDKGTSILPYRDIYTIGQRFPSLPYLKKGSYEFVVYEKDEKGKYILDTFQFEVV